MVTTILITGDPTTVMDEAEARSIHDRLIGLVGGTDDVKLDMSGRTFSPGAAEVISNSIRPFADRIVEVNFSSILDHLSLTQARQVVACFVGSLVGAPLTSVNMSNNALGGNGCFESLGPLLSKSTLTKLYLADTGLGEAEMEELFNFLDGSNAPLELLHLARNSSGDAGAEYFGFILETVLTLEDVQYSNNRAGTIGSEAIAQGLQERARYDKRNPDLAHVLKRLDLEGAFFNVNGGFDVLIGALRNLRGLQYLNLMDCEIHSTGQAKIQRIVGRIDGIQLLIGEEEDSDAEVEVEDFSVMHL